MYRDVKHLTANTKKTAENTFEQAEANGERELTLSMHSLKIVNRMTFLLFIFVAVWSEITFIHLIQ